MTIENSPALFVGVLGLGLVQVVGLYESTAPDLQDLRNRPQGDPDARQHLLDADILVGTTVLIVAVAASVSMNSTWPFFFLVGGFAMCSYWHRAVLNAPKYK